MFTGGFDIALRLLLFCEVASESVVRVTEDSLFWADKRGISRRSCLSELEALCGEAPSPVRALIGGADSSATPKAHLVHGHMVLVAEDEAHLTTLKKALGARVQWEVTETHLPTSRPRSRGARSPWW
jgi:hypothetical protein